MAPENPPAVDVSPWNHGSILDAIHQRRSCRAYLPSPVPPALIHSILDAARHAPTAWARQSCEFLVIENRQTLDAASRAIRQFYRSLLRWRPLLRWFVPALRAPELDDVPSRIRHSSAALPDDTIFHGAPCVIFCCAHRRHVHGLNDCHLAAENLLIAATAHGLGSLFTGSALAVNHLTAVRRAIQLPDTHRIHCVCAIGYANQNAAEEPRPQRQPNILRWLK